MAWLGLASPTSKASLLKFKENNLKFVLNIKKKKTPETRQGRISFSFNKNKNRTSIVVIIWIIFKLRIKPQTTNMGRKETKLED